MSTKEGHLALCCHRLRHGHFEDKKGCRNSKGIGSLQYLRTQLVSHLHLVCQENDNAVEHMLIPLSGMTQILEIMKSAFGQRNLNKYEIYFSSLTTTAILRFKYMYIYMFPSQVCLDVEFCGIDLGLVAKEMCSTYSLIDGEDDFRAKLFTFRSLLNFWVSIELTEKNLDLRNGIRVLFYVETRLSYAWRWLKQKNKVSLVKLELDVLGSFKLKTYLVWKYPRMSISPLRKALRLSYC